MKKRSRINVISEDSMVATVTSPKEYDNLQAIYVNRHKPDAHELIDAITGSFLVCGLSRLPKGELKIHQMTVVAGDLPEIIKLTQHTSTLLLEILQKAAELNEPKEGEK